MSSYIKKLIFTFIFNISLFLMLFIIIQNSENKNKVNLIIIETIELPISFILGVSFISGSIIGSLIDLNNIKQK